MDNETPPPAEVLNRLLAKCNQETYPSKQLSLAIKNSSFHLSIWEESTGKLVGFVRATSDYGLNANLWNFVAEPSPRQKQFLAVLAYRALEILKRTMPGCSISVSAPAIAVEALKENGFLIDPGGIRAMGLHLR